MDNINLIGSEDVFRASHNMQNAASEISRAASSMDHSLLEHRRYLDEFIVRFEEALKPSQENGDEG